jgi:hypothetical protein
LALAVYSGNIEFELPRGFAAPGDIASHDASPNAASISAETRVLRCWMWLFMAWDRHY